MVADADTRQPPSAIETEASVGHGANAIRQTRGEEIPEQPQPSPAPKTRSNTPIAESLGSGLRSSSSRLARAGVLAPLQRAVEARIGLVELIDERQSQRYDGEHPRTPSTAATRYAFVAW
jgi:hypothetical protein